VRPLCGWWSLNRRGLAGVTGLRSGVASVGDMGGEGARRRERAEARRREAFERRRHQVGPS